MKIIGAGFGRTGMMSLRAALELLGFAPCYHMLEVFKRPGHIKIWQAAADGKPVETQNPLRQGTPSFGSFSRMSRRHR